MGLLGGLRSKDKHAPKQSVGPGPVRGPAAVSKPRRGALTASPAAGAGPRSPSPRFARSRSSRTSPSSPRNQGAERAVADALGGGSSGRQRDPASSRMESGEGALLAGSRGRNGRVLIKASRTPAAWRRARGESSLSNSCASAPAGKARRWPRPFWRRSRKRSRGPLGGAP